MRLRRATWSLALLVGASAGSPRSHEDGSTAHRALPAPTLRLNLPAYRVDVSFYGAVIGSYPVAVGAPQYGTPLGEFEITRVVWNPWWYPPKRGWAMQDTITPPGPANPMGKVKLLMHGPYYLHGTPFSASLGHAASHGCIRMRNADAITIARLVQLYGGARISSAETDSLAGASYATRIVDLPAPIAFEVVYELAEVRAGLLAVYPDVYRQARGTRREEALLALDRAGHDTALVDDAALRRLLRRATTHAATAPVDSIVHEPFEAPLAMEGSR